MLRRWLLTGLLSVLGAVPAGAQSSYRDLDKPPHNYWSRPLQDPFSRLKADLEAGKVNLNRSSERAFVASLLKVLEIPASSQMLVFSTTSLQLRLISPSNPRALYFNDDLYLGYVPGGRIEIVSMDPEVGGIYYIFDIPRGEQPLKLERSDRCMNCHASDDTGQVPGLVIKSVVPGPQGGSLTAFRLEQTGHGIPFEQRFGGWYLTGKHGITNHWGNLTGRLSAQGLATFPVQPGSAFSFARYPVATSDVLPQLLHEHQAGFVNRAVEAAYRIRTDLYLSHDRLPAAQVKELDEQAHLLTRYLLFADEVPLPAGGIGGDAVYKADFLRSRRAAQNGASLKDFDLQTRLFKNRCSYMIYSVTFQGLPMVLKQRVYAYLQAALKTEKPEAEYAYLSTSEKTSIRTILKETLTDLPAGW